MNKSSKSMPSRGHRINVSAIAGAVNSREAELLRLIASDAAVNQRQLSQQMHLSLGMTNLLLRRLVEKGYVQVAPVNKRKVKYVLSAKGLQELNRRSLETAARTIEVIGRVRSRLQEILGELYGRGERRFYLLGHSELVPLIEQIVGKPEMEGCTLSTRASAAKDEVVLVCSPDHPKPPSSETTHIDLIEELAKKDDLMAFSQLAVVA